MSPCALSAAGAAANARENATACSAELRDMELLRWMWPGWAAATIEQNRGARKWFGAGPMVLKGRRAQVPVGDALKGVSRTQRRGFVERPGHKLQADGHPVAGEAGVDADRRQPEVAAGAGQASDAGEDRGGALAPAEVGLGDGRGRDAEHRRVQQIDLREHLRAEFGERRAAHAKGVDVGGCRNGE